MSIEAINVSASSTAMGVALKAPAMFLRHLFKRSIISHCCQILLNEELGHSK